LELVGAPEGFVARRRHGHDGHPLSFEQAAGGLEEARAVVDDEGAKCHQQRIEACTAPGHSR
jgi:hypothetical protein